VAAARAVPSTAEAVRRIVAQTVFAPVRQGDIVAETVARLGQAIGMGLLRPGDRLPPEARLADLEGGGKDVGPGKGEGNGGVGGPFLARAAQHRRCEALFDRSPTRHRGLTRRRSHSRRVTRLRPSPVQAPTSRAT